MAYIHVKAARTPLFFGGHPTVLDPSARSEPSVGYAEKLLGSKAA